MMRREYGSLLPDLVDQLFNATLFSQAQPT